jgi:hypothetical protein
MKITLKKMIAVIKAKSFKVLPSVIGGFLVSHSIHLIASPVSTGQILKEEIPISRSKSILLPPGAWQVEAFFDSQVPVTGSHCAHLCFGGDKSTQTIKNIVLTNTDNGSPLSVYVASWSEFANLNWGGNNSCALEGNLRQPFTETFGTNLNSATVRCSSGGRFINFRNVVRDAASSQNSFVKANFSHLSSKLTRLPVHALTLSGSIRKIGGDTLTWFIYIDPIRAGISQAVIDHQMTSASLGSGQSLSLTENPINHVLDVYHGWGRDYLLNVEARFYPSLFNTNGQITKRLDLPSTVTVPIDTAKAETARRKQLEEDQRQAIEARERERLATEAEARDRQRLVAEAEAAQRRQRELEQRLAAEATERSRLAAEAEEARRQQQQLQERLAQEAKERERLLAEARERDRPQSTQPTAPRQERRVALVVGNAAYKNQPLANPVNDATDVASTLRGMGFETTLLRDATLTQMRNATRQFADAAASSDVALIFFAGHGIEAKGRNYVIPVGAEIKHEYELEDQAYDAGRWLDMLEGLKTGSRQRVNIVILDACRNNEFARSWRSSSRGLARMDAPTGTFVAFATAPGKVAADGARGQRNSPFTKSLLRAIQSPDMPIELMFKEVRRMVVEETNNEQVPWDNSSLVGDFAFRRTR